MGQIIGGAAKPKRCNLNQLSQVPTPASGEHILVSSDNSMNAAGQGYFDSYIIGNGTTAATALELHKYKAEELDEQINGTFVSYDESAAVTANAGINNTFSVSIPAGTYQFQSNYTDFWDASVNLYVYFKSAGTTVLQSRIGQIGASVTLPSDIDTIQIYTATSATSGGTLTIGLLINDTEGSIVSDIEELKQLEVIPDILNGYDDIVEGVLPVTAGMELSLSNSRTEFQLPAGTYTINYDGGGVISQTIIYFKDASDNTINFTTANGFTLGSLTTQRTGSASEYQPITIPTDVSYILFYGGIASSRGNIRVYVIKSHVDGLIEKTNDIDDRLEEVEQNYLPKDNVPFIKRVLYHADKVIPTGGSPNYRSEILLTIDSASVKKDSMYIFTCDGPVNSNNRTPLQIIAENGDVYTGGEKGFTKPFAYLIPSHYEYDNGVEVTSLRFRLYPYNDGAVFRNVEIYTWEEYEMTNEVDVATTTISKLALAPHRISETCKSVAHRGYAWTAPQNMLSAVLEAKKQGYTAVENDVALTADNEFVMWHDTSLERLKMLRDINGYFMYSDGNGNFYWYDADNNALYTWDGTQYVASSVSLSSLTQCAGANYSINTLNISILKRIDFGSWKSSKYKGETIPTFEEWISYCKVLGLNVWIDFKLTDAQVSSYAEVLVGIVRKYGMLRNSMWLAGSSSTSIRLYDNKAVCVMLVAPDAGSVEALSDLLAQGGEGSVIFDPEWSELTQANAALALNAGYGLSAWYVDFFPNSTDRAVIFQNIVNTMKLGVQNFTLDIYTIEDVIYENYLK